MGGIKPLGFEEASARFLVSARRRQRQHRAYMAAPDLLVEMSEFLLHRVRREKAALSRGESPTPGDLAPPEVTMIRGSGASRRARCSIINRPLDHWRRDGFGTWRQVSAAQQLRRLSDGTRDVASACIRAFVAAPQSSHLSAPELGSTLAVRHLARIAEARW